MSQDDDLRRVYRRYWEALRALGEAGYEDKSAALRRAENAWDAFPRQNDDWRIALSEQWEHDKPAQEGV